MENVRSRAILLYTGAVYNTLRERNSLVSWREETKKTKVVLQETP